MYIPGRFLTASKPSRTWIWLSSYLCASVSTAVSAAVTSSVKCSFSKFVFSCMMFSLL